MRIATWRGGDAFTIDEAPEPRPGRGEVLLRIHTAGICGSDIHATQGLFPATPPRVLGHEYSAVVADVGRGLRRDLIGRAVACEPSVGCGTCTDCAQGRVSQCSRCVRIGGFAERVVLPRSHVHPLPDGLDLATAALAEPAACCLEGLRMFRCRRGRRCWCSEAA
jgi:threonine dehydrogenase-like Zn-dependent dehydrogenase